ncbi:hypothetical protein K431DRAFT_259065 [Polychaeton citri CBS 116435]|uniref:DUF4484 domain-containing protein n=1 Tax=Polychaeton citri CBS 116435 TaxID=1314669 RepID=A0A9P4QGX4_9PEZI|nr:hypothetical protein K431DRAFT_259065 [Polychaeton citri CBS 116435]
MSFSTSTPTIAALFRVVFDQKVGYTLAYRQSQQTDETSVEQLFDGIEFKCLPSGLHQVEEDTVYFTQSTPGSARFAGISVFLQGHADEAHRNATFVAVGALARLDGSNGRLGRIWEFRKDMQRLAADVINLDKSSADELLDEYWTSATRRQDASLQDDRQVVTVTPGDKAKRKPSRSQDSEHHLESDDHPSLSLPGLWYLFGPLIFPLYRAALTRKRILLLGSPPVLNSCNFVYALSVLATLPPDVRPLVEGYPSDQCHVLPTLFSVGVHNIPDLEHLNRHIQTLEKGWIATSTDGILATKTSLFDCCVELPSHHPPLDPDGPAHRTRPIFRASDGRQIKASARDYHRWRLVERGLRHCVKTLEEHYQDDPQAGTGDGDTETETLVTPVDQQKHDAMEEGIELSPEDERELVEPQSWTRAAFDSLRWFTSAAEIERCQQVEHELDISLLPKDLAPEPSDNNEISNYEKSLRQAKFITKYFHNLTRFLQHHVHEIVEKADEGSHDESDPECDVIFAEEDLAQCGLDVSRDADCLFAVEMARKWYGRTAEIEAPDTWEVCGIRIC